jgi:threonine dehydrogenase-like Zn-dependent dehydrogenase
LRVYALIFRCKLATEFGATDIVTERGDDGVAKIKDLTNGLGADSVVEAVGTQESMLQAIGSTRPAAGTSASSASPTGSSCPSKGCSGPTCTYTAARHRCAASCPSSST